MTPGQAHGAYTYDATRQHWAADLTRDAEGKSVKVVEGEQATDSLYDANGPGSSAVTPAPPPGQ